jgi:integrase
MVFRTLDHWRHGAPNPFDGIRRRPVVPESRRELSERELRTLCREAEGELRVLFAIGLYTALRLGDACTLRWEETRLDRGTIVRVPNKTRSRSPKPIVIPIHPVLRAILEETPASDRSGFVLPGLAAMYDLGSGTGTSRISRLVRDHFVACGIQTREPRENGRRAICRVGFHSLRHSFVSICASEGVPMPVVQELCGHSSPAIQQVYTHMGMEATSRAIHALPALEPSPREASVTREAMLAEAQALLREASTEALEQVLAMLQGVGTARL